MSTSFIILSIIILLIMFGAGQRILDSLRLSDSSALLILFAICIGLIIPPIWIGEYFCFSIGGFLIPLALSIYLLISCGWSRDLARAFFGTVIVAGVIYALEWILPADPESVLIDNSYVYGIVAGVVAYVLGRSRRNAFISCLFGITLAMVVQWVINFVNNTPSILGLGVGGAFGTYIVSIVISVAVSEFMGRAFQNASQNSERKVYNYETNTYDSEKNGKLKSITKVSNDNQVTVSTTQTDDYLISNLADQKTASYMKDRKSSAKDLKNKVRKDNDISGAVVSKRDVSTKQQSRRKTTKGAD